MVKRRLDKANIQVRFLWAGWNESVIGGICSSLAQLAERLTVNQEDAGSRPARGACRKRHFAVVWACNSVRAEYLTCNEEVAGSNPVASIDGFRGLGDTYGRVAQRESSGLAYRRLRVRFLSRPSVENRVAFVAQPGRAPLS
jgi:hypothetical protein